MSSKAVQAEIQAHIQELEHLTGVRSNVQAFPVGSAAAEAVASSGAERFLLKTVSFVRHGQGVHNVAAERVGHGCTCGVDGDARPCPYIDPSLLDPPLTELGRQQATALEQVAAAAQPEVVLVSPLTRALETATLACVRCVGGASVGGDTTGPVRFEAIEDAREQAGLHICDRRRSVTQLKPLFPHVDFAGLASDDDAVWTPLREDKQLVAERAGRLIAHIGRRPEQRLCVVTHSSFLLTLFNAVLLTDVSPELRRWFETGELRTVVLAFPRQ